MFSVVDPIYKFLRFLFWNWTRRFLALGDRNSDVMARGVVVSFDVEVTHREGGGVTSDLLLALYWVMLGLQSSQFG
jgi:hypothetical protein